MRKIPYSALPEHQGIFQDLTEISDLHGAYEAIQLAETAMMALPAELRAKFDNDPKKFVEYMQDEKNIEESRKLGLRSKKTSDDEIVEEAKPQGAASKKTKPQTPPPDDSSGST